MKTVFVVVYCYYEDMSIIGTFDSLKLANEFLDEYCERTGLEKTSLFSIYRSKLNSKSGKEAELEF